MANLLPFANDITLELFDEAQGLVVGYMFPSAGADPVAQEQRWVLYREYRSPPALSVALRVPEDPVLQLASRDRFIEALRSTNGPVWRDGARYVKVVAQYIGPIPPTNPEPPPIPTLTFGDAPTTAASPDVHHHPVADPYKGRRWPEGPVPSIQIDDHPAILTSRSMAPMPEGYVFGTAIERSPAPGVNQNFEYWVTFPGYLQASTSQSLFLRNDTTESHKSLSEFLDAMRALEGASLMVASCAYAFEIPNNP